MSWKKACVVYVIALIVATVVNIEKVSVWVDEQLADGPAPSVARQVRRVRNLWRESGLGPLSRDVDCALAPYFDETYKNSLACRDVPRTRAEALALQKRLDPNQPVLKDDIPVNTADLLAALAPPRSPLGLEGTPATMTDTGTATASGQASGANGPTLAQGKLPAPHKLLVVGDSLAIGLSLSLRRSVASLDGLQLIEEGKVSSGLANPKYYNWGKALRVFLDKYKPDIVVIMMGANDAKYINLNEKNHPAGSANKTWAEVFTIRVGHFLEALQERDIRNYWVGLPIMGDPAYARQAEVMNDILKTQCGRFSASTFLDTWSLLADAGGHYSTFLPNDKGVKIKVRANDKVHFTVAGGDILAQSFLAAMAKDVELRPKTPDAAHVPPVPAP